MKAKQSRTCEIYWHIYKSRAQKDTATKNHFRTQRRFLGLAQSGHGIFVEWLNKHRFAAISIFPSSWRDWRGVAVRGPAPLQPVKNVNGAAGSSSSSGLNLELQEAAQKL